MAPQSVVAPPPDEAVQEKKAGAPAHREPATSATPPRSPQAEGPVSEQLRAGVGYKIFEEALLDMSGTRPQRRTIDFVFSLFIHFLVLTTFILLPLYFTEAIDMKQFTSTLLVAPPPPPPPPPPAAPAVARVMVRRVFTSAGKLVAPTVIPKSVAMLKEQELPPDVGAVGVVGGVPGGVPGGQLGGVIGGIIGGIPGANLPPPPKATPKTPIRVGGRVRAPRPISTPQPFFPTLARSAKVQGDVVVDAVIDTGGNVVEMKVVSGHPLLITAALDALRRWKYEPTYLNDEPVPVVLLVTVRFRLN